MPTASLVGSGEKLGMNPWIGQSTCCGLCWEPFFLGSSVIRPNLSVSRKRLLYVDYMRRMVEGHTQTERGKCVAYRSGFPLHGVHQFESPRLSYMSNRLFVAVIT
jgi:hypothetical protein